MNIERHLEWYLAVYLWPGEFNNSHLNQTVSEGAIFNKGI